MLLVLSLESVRSDGTQWLFRVRVLVGQFAVGTGDMIEAPAGCDTAVDDMDRPSCYVTFKDDQAYPEYVIGVKSQQ